MSTFSPDHNYCSYRSVINHISPLNTTVISGLQSGKADEAVSTLGCQEKGNHSLNLRCDYFLISDNLTICLNVSPFGDFHSLIQFYLVYDRLPTLPYSSAHITDVICVESSDSVSAGLLMSVALWSENKMQS